MSDKSKARDDREELPSARPPGTLVDRLDLDGVNEYHKSKNKIVKFFWFSVTSTMYVTAAVFSYLTITRYDLGKTIVTVVDQPPVDSVGFFVANGVCLGTFWNKTYFEENIQVPDEIMEKAMHLGLTTKSRVLSEFAKFMSYYNFYFFDDAQDIREEIWSLMKDLYDYIAKKIQTMDIARDGIIRANVLQCSFKDQKYPCDKTIPFSTDMPSCHLVLLDPRHAEEYKTQRNTFERATLKFDIRLPIKDTFYDEQVESRSSSDAGVKILLAGVPSVLSPVIVSPANTHATILFHLKQVKLKYNCKGRYFAYESDGSNMRDGFNAIDKEFQWIKTYDPCVAAVGEYAARNVCGCYLSAGTFYPSNNLACTPDQIRNCVQPKLMEALRDERYIKQLRKCPPLCMQTNLVASVTYYDLENVSNDTIRNIITLRPNLDHEIFHEEIDLANLYVAFSEVAGVIGVYTGFSVASIVRVLGLFVAAGIRLAIYKLVKPALMSVMRLDMPLNVRWEAASPLFRRRRLGPVRTKVTDLGMPEQVMANQIQRCSIESIY